MIDMEMIAAALFIFAPISCIAGVIIYRTITPKCSYMAKRESKKNVITCIGIGIAFNIATAIMLITLHFAK